MGLKIDRITFSVERTINMGNYESVKVKAEYSASTSDYENDMKKLKKLLYKEIDKESEKVFNQYSNVEE